MFLFVPFAYDVWVTAVLSQVSFCLFFSCLMGIEEMLESSQFILGAARRKKNLLAMRG